MISKNKYSLVEYVGFSTPNGFRGVKTAMLVLLISVPAAMYKQDKKINILKWHVNIGLNGSQKDVLGLIQRTSLKIGTLLNS